MGQMLRTCEFIPRSFVVEFDRMGRRGLADLGASAGTDGELSGLRNFH